MRRDIQKSGLYFTAYPGLSLVSILADTRVDSIGAPMESVGAPMKSVGAPMESVGASVESIGAPASRAPFVILEGRQAPLFSLSFALNINRGPSSMNRQNAGNFRPVFTAIREAPMEDAIIAAAEAIKKASALVVCAGAGMGVDSGLPDFRGNQGFWKAYPPYKRLGLGFVNMADPSWFFNDPELAWGFYGHRLALYRRTVPHDGFRILLEWGKNKPDGYFVFTSNVDGQFQKTGFDPDAIEECHGSLHHLQCTTPCNNAIWSAADIDVEVDESTMRAVPPLPRCTCGTLARPNVLMFGDWHWLSQRSSAQSERFGSWLERVRMREIVVVECGAGTAVPTVRYTSERLVKSHTATLIRINMREPEVPARQIGMPMGALEALRQIDARVR